MNIVNTGGVAGRPGRSLGQTLEEGKADGDGAGAAQERAPVDGVLPSTLPGQAEALQLPRLPVDDGPSDSLGSRITRDLRGCGTRRF